MKHTYERFWEYQGHQIIECLECGYKHVNPLPDQDQLVQFYQNTYHNQCVAFPYHEITDKHINYCLSKVDSNPEYLEIYQRVSEYLKPSSQYSMLDIGCGHNLLLKFFQNKGWQAIGVEPGKEAAVYLRRYGLDIIEASVEEVDRCNLRNISFVNVQFVLEHTAHPLEILQKLYSVLEPGGIIRVCVPNDFGEGQLAYLDYFKAEAKWVKLPDHVNYFNFKSISDLLARAGFSEVYRTTNFPLEFLLLGGINYYASEEEHQKVGPFVKNFENSLIETGRKDFLKDLYHNLAKSGFGRSVFMYAVKNE